jgi:hypothetical protein
MRKSAWVVNSDPAATLSHLRAMDHSPRFWDTVRSMVPDYAELRGQRSRMKPFPCGDVRGRRADQGLSKAQVALVKNYHIKTSLLIKLINYE